MKFIELINGDHICWEKVKRLTYEITGKNRENIYSYVYLETGEHFDFLDISSTFIAEEGKEEKLEGLEVMLLHRLSIDYIERSQDTCISMDDLMGEIWPFFLELRRA